MLAQATTPNQVLDAWVLFRYRQPKRLCHFMMTLKRLVEVGGCDATDWRLQILLSRLRRGYKRVINLHTLMGYFSRLGLYQEIDKLTLFAKPRLPFLKKEQLVSVMESLGECQTRDSAIMGLCMRRLSRNYESLSTRDGICLISALGNSEIRNTRFVSLILSEIVKRDLSLDEYCALISATRSARYRDFCVAELAVAKAKASLTNGENLDEVCRLVKELSLIGVNDIMFSKHVAITVDPDQVSLSSLISLVSGCIGIVDSEILLPHFALIRESVILIDSHSELLHAASAVDRASSAVPDSKSFLTELGYRLTHLGREKEKYNTALLANIFARNEVFSKRIWKAIWADTRYSVPHFEPEDFLTAAKTFGSLPSDILGDRVHVLANELSEWALKRWEEFGVSEWRELQASLTVDNLKCSEWSRNELSKWGEVIAKSKTSDRIRHRYRSSVS